MKPLEPSLAAQFGTGRLYAIVTSRPGQCGRCDGRVVFPVVTRWPPAALLLMLPAAHTAAAARAHAGTSWKARSWTSTCARCRRRRASTPRTHEEKSLCEEEEWWWKSCCRSGTGTRKAPRATKKKSTSEESSEQRHRETRSIFGIPVSCVSSSRARGWNLSPVVVVPVRPSVAPTTTGATAREPPLTVSPMFPDCRCQLLQEWDWAGGMRHRTSSPSKVNQTGRLCPGRSSGAAG